MKNKFKWSGLVALVGFLTLASGTASATPISFDFTNEGTANISTCGWGCSQLTTSGDLEIGGVVVGGFSGTMRLLGIGLTTVDQTVSTWSFVDNSGTNSLFGSLGGDVLNLFALGGGWLTYAVQNGTGLFANATGGGSSAFGFLGNWYHEEGHLNVQTASVPEPGATMLLLVALGMAGVLAYRRRRLQSQI